MTWIRVIDYATSSGYLRQLYDRVKGPEDRIDNVMKAHSLRPHTMEGHSALYKSVLHHAGNTSPVWWLETVGVYTSLLNRCAYSAAHHFAVEATEDAAQFNDQNLGRFAVIMFLNTTGNVLDAAQQTALERFIQDGGGFVGVHSATDTEYDWPFYEALVGTYFASHPAIQEADIHVVNDAHPSTAHLPEPWVRVDEWYNFRRLPPAASCEAMSRPRR